jgi:hypothetical protein
MVDEAMIAVTVGLLLGTLSVSKQVTAAQVEAFPLGCPD